MTSRSHETVLVTGAAGFIGSHVVERLLADGATVVGVDNYDPSYPIDEKRQNQATASTSDRYVPFTLDCTDLPALEYAVRRRPITAVIHLAARTGVRPSLLDPIGYAQANVVGTQAVLEFARRRGASRILFASSSSVYGEADCVQFDETMASSAPVSPYAATKRAGELLCATHSHLFGASILALRFFTVFGPRQRPDLAIRRFTSLMLDGRAIPLHGDGSSARDYTWIGDIVDGVISALDFTRAHPGVFEAVNLGGNRMTTLRELIGLLEAALGTKAHIETLPAHQGAVSRTCANLAKAARLLAYSPSVTVEEGLPEFVAWLRSRRRRATQPGRRLSLMTGHLVQ